MVRFLDCGQAYFYFAELDKSGVSIYSSKSSKSFDDKCLDLCKIEISNMRDVGWSVELITASTFAMVAPWGDAFFGSCFIEGNKKRVSVSIKASDKASDKFWACGVVAEVDGILQAYDANGVQI